MSIYLLQNFEKFRWDFFVLKLQILRKPSIANCNLAPADKDISLIIVKPTLKYIAHIGSQKIYIVV